MRKVLVLIAVMALSVALLVGCTPEPEEELSYDDQFLNTLVEALGNRWSIVEEMGTGATFFDSQRSELTALVDAELDTINTFQGEPENPRIIELREQYLEGLNQQRESLQYIDVDFMRFSDMFDEASGIRASAIVAFVDEFNLDLNEENLHDIRVQARLYEERQELAAAIADMMDGLEFELTEDDGWMASYETVVENTTNVEFSSFTIEVTLFDADGVAIDTTFAHASSWSPGQSNRFDFTAFEEFESMEIGYSYFIDN